MHRVEQCGGGGGGVAVVSEVGGPAARPSALPRLALRRVLRAQQLHDLVQRVQPGLGTGTHNLQVRKKI